ncbi:hypothetical protein SNE40_017183 [Patella caerulea]|uniref:PiggyBac transposable element-derived protein domain-containing protein n=1 Tax=Patella caerulea TaxID=87958 RepID=A0AAN8JGL6_PATCE
MKFLDDEIVENIFPDKPIYSATRSPCCFQINLYIQQQDRRVSPLTPPELYDFVGINFLMGYHILPSWRDFWQTDFDLAVPFVSFVMPRDRFGQILSDNRAMSTDKLYKVRPLINKLNSNYVKLYNVSKHVSIDESKIRYKGRHSLEQYNPMKPMKRGYKLWMRSDLDDGYTTKFDVYQGKNGNNEVRDDDDNVEFGLDEKVAIDLTADLQKKHEAYFDNFFTSVRLLDYIYLYMVFTHVEQ